jgi:hypothetical protein
MRLRLRALFCVLSFLVFPHPTTGDQAPGGSNWSAVKRWNVWTKVMYDHSRVARAGSGFYPMSVVCRIPGAKSIVLSGRSGSWHDALHVTVEDAAGKKAEWPWRRPSSERGPVTLDGAGRNRVGLVAGRPQTQTIPPGRYTLKAVLDTPATETS